MAETPEFFQTSEYPAGNPPVQLTVIFEVFRDEKGGSAARFSAPEGSELVAKYGGAGAALAACKDAITAALESLVEEFEDQESTS